MCKPSMDAARRLVSRAPGAWSVQSRSQGKKYLGLVFSTDEMDEDAGTACRLPLTSSRSASLAAARPAAAALRVTFARGFLRDARLR